MRISSQNLGLKIFFKYFLYLIFETLFRHVGEKLPQNFFCHSVKQKWCYNYTNFDWCKFCFKENIQL